MESGGHFCLGVNMLNCLVDTPFYNMDHIRKQSSDSAISYCGMLASHGGVLPDFGSVWNVPYCVLIQQKLVIIII